MPETSFICLNLVSNSESARDDPTATNNAINNDKKYLIISNINFRPQVTKNINNTNNSLSSRAEMNGQR